MPYKDPQKHKEYMRKYGSAYEEGYKDRRKELRKKRKDDLRKVVWDYLSKHPCVDCGEDDPIVLEFDHKDRNTKRYTISNVVSHNLSKEILLEEIIKCEVRCANCHRRRTAQQMGWYKDLF